MNFKPEYVPTFDQSFEIDQIHGDRRHPETDGEWNSVVCSSFVWLSLKYCNPMWRPIALVVVV